MSDWFGKNCKYQCCVFEKYLDGVEDTSMYELVFCNHIDNPDDCEGNCRKEWCPLKS